MDDLAALMSVPPLEETNGLKYEDGQVRFPNSTMNLVIYVFSTLEHSSHADVRQRGPIVT